MSRKLSVVEIFNSIQGEGANAGKSATFIRLSGCNMNCSYCDTAWKNGVEMTLEDIKAEIGKFTTKLLIWTGGEPTLQLDEEVLSHFSAYTNAIETNGTNPIPKGINYISCSPKVDVEILKKNFDFVNEFRFPVIKGKSIPSIDELPKAENYFLSPVFLGNKLSQENLEYCLGIIEKDPRWRLSVQLHKLLDVK